MKTINAVDMIFAFNGIVIGCAQATTLAVTRAMDAAACSATGAWQQSSPGIKSWTANVNAIYRQPDANQVGTPVLLEDVFDALDEGSLVDIEYGTNLTGDKRFKGQAYVNNLSFAKPETGIVTWSADLTGNGPLEVVTVGTPLVAAV